MLGQTIPPKVMLYLLIVLGVLILGVGTLVLLGLWGSWRRFNQRQRAKRSPQPMPDAWQESGRRLLSRLDNEGSSPSPIVPGDPENLLDNDPDQDDAPPFRRPTFLDQLDDHFDEDKNQNKPQPPHADDPDESDEDDDDPENPPPKPRPQGPRGTD